MLVRISRFNSFRRYFLRNKDYVFSTFGVTIALSIFFIILRNLEPNDFIASLDTKATNFLVRKRTKTLNILMRYITYFASWQVVTYFFFLLSIYLYKTRHWNTLVAFVASIGGGLTFIGIIKGFIKRERPDIINRLMKETTSSFPSGHSFMAVCLYGFVLYLVFHYFDNSIQKFIAMLFFGSTILTIGFSRVYLGVHWLSDVLGSFSAGTAWLVSVLTMLQIKRNRDYLRKYNP